jgi:hypothetical protein
MDAQSNGPITGKWATCLQDQAGYVDEEYTIRNDYYTVGRSVSLNDAEA